MHLLHRIIADALDSLAAVGPPDAWMIHQNLPPPLADAAPLWHGCGKRSLGEVQPDSAIIGLTCANALSRLGATGCFPS